MTLFLFCFPPLPPVKVKVDESLSLDHVTRDRVKVSHGRRPPTRSHLKEVSTPCWSEPSHQLGSPRAAPSIQVPNPGENCASTSLMKLQVPIDLYLLQHITIYLAFHNS